MGGGVCAFAGEFGEAWDDQGKGLGIDDVPVEGVDLGEWLGCQWGDV